MQNHFSVVRNDLFGLQYNLFLLQNHFSLLHGHLFDLLHKLLLLVGYFLITHNCSPYRPRINSAAHSVSYFKMTGELYEIEINVLQIDFCRLICWKFSSIGGLAPQTP